MLELNNFTEIANKITPNIFLITFIPFSPNNFSILEEVLSTIYINIVLIIMASKIFTVAYSALKDKSVVKLPGPAIKGKAKGNTETVLALVLSSLYNEIPKIISKARKNRIKDPATAKECTSIPIKFRILFPKNKKETIIIPATKEAFSD